jgi:hypothetical protein
MPTKNSTSKRPAKAKTPKADRRPWRCMPDGTRTRNVVAYIGAWRRLGSKAASAFGPEWICWAFDPGLLLRPGAGPGISLTLDQATALCRLIDERDSAVRALVSLSRKKRS